MNATAWKQPSIKIIPMRKIEESSYILHELLEYAATNSGFNEDDWCEFVRDNFDPIDMQHMKEQVDSVTNNKMFEFTCSIYRMKFDVKLDLWFKDLYEEFSL
jgi:hypothetical protein